VPETSGTPETPAPRSVRYRRRRTVRVVKATATQSTVDKSGTGATRGGPSTDKPTASVELAPAPTGAQAAETAGAPAAPTTGPAAPATGVPAATAQPGWPGGQVPAAPPGFFARHWPGHGRTAPPVALAAVGVTGLVAAASLPLDRPGIGWLCTGLAAAAATSVVARRAATSASPLSIGAKLRRVAWGTATLALLAVGLFRAAGWLFTLCVLTALVTGSLAVGGGTTVAGMVRGAFAVPLAALRALPWGTRGLAALRGATGVSVVRLVATGAVTVLLLGAFGALFASADAAFAAVAADLLPDIGIATVIRWIFVFTVVGLGTLGAAYLVSAPPDLDGAGGARRARLRRVEWALPVGLLDLLFAGFVLVQLTVLFGGATHVLRTADLTYAEYARGGFWQLLFVTALTLLVLGAAARWAPRDTMLDRLLVRTLLGALAALTLVVVASALYRMHVYEQAYGFTRLRLFVQAVEVWLGGVFLMVLIAGVRLRARWLPQAVAASAVAVLLGLAALNPDRLIAERNIDRYVADGQLDVSYLAELSADAVPALERLDGPQRDCAQRFLIDDLRDDPDDWRGFNLARATARDILAGRSRAAETACSTWVR